MVWAQKNMMVLAVAVNYRTAALAFGTALLVHCSSFDQAHAALESDSYSALVIDPAGHTADAQRLVEHARALDPNLRIIFSSRRTPPGLPVAGELLVAGNGRQFVRGLRSMLGC
jgi:hypothetical protein